MLALIGAGLGNREIALALSIGVGTVKSHVHNLLAKTNSTQRSQLALIAHEHQEPMPSEDEDAE